MWRDRQGPAVEGPAEDQQGCGGTDGVSISSYCEGVLVLKNHARPRATRYPLQVAHAIISTGPGIVLQRVPAQRHPLPVSDTSDAKNCNCFKV